MVPNQTAASEVKNADSKKKKHDGGCSVDPARPLALDTARI